MRLEASRAPCVHPGRARRLGLGGTCPSTTPTLPPSTRSVSLLLAHNDSLVLSSFVTACSTSEKMASWTSGFDKRTRSPPPDRYRYYAEPDYSDYKGRDSGDRRRYSDFPLHRGFDDKRAFPRSPSRDAYDGACSSRLVLSFQAHSPPSTSLSPSPNDLDRLLKRKRSVSPPNRYVRPRYDEGMLITRCFLFNIAITFLQGYRGRSPGRRYSPEPRSRGPPDPILADNPVSFRNFIEWFKYKYPTEFYDDEQERLKQPQAVPPEDGAEGKEPSSSPAKKPLVKVRYDEYRKRFMKKQVSLADLRFAQKY